MYTSFIGKKFLKQYNEKNNLELNPKEFFNTVQFPVFFDDQSHLMHVHGSTFFQKVGKSLKTKERDSIIRLNRLHSDVANGKLSASTYVGYAAEKTTGVTSGQVSSINNSVNEDEIYASWIGAGLGIGVLGRYLMLFDDLEIQWGTFLGWKYYRKFLNQTPNLKNKEIEMWNTHWLIHYFSPDFDLKNPFVGLEIETETSMGETRLKKKTWSEVIFSLSKKYPKKIFTVYAYQLDKTNTTLGFINIYLPEIRKMFELRDAIFIKENETILSDKEIEQLSTYYNFKDACQIGTIGLKALEPANLREYMPKGSIINAKGKDFKISDDESFINYQLYKIWITAMLNKTDLLNLASNVATALIELEKTDERGKKIFTALSQDVRDAKSIKDFIDKLSAVLGQQSDNAEIFRNVVVQVLKMPSDNFPLFITLIRFEYNYQKTKN